jgi:N-acyl homoserine lactone hydrolase
MTEIEVRRVDFGYFVRPGSETDSGAPRVEPCLGYLVHHPRGTLLLDTGMGSHPEVNAHYRPRRVDLSTALNEVGTAPDDVTYLTNCHLHFDHCGGNPLLTGRPVFVQQTELHQAQTTTDYTLPELIEHATYEELDGSAEVLPGVHLMPTPGHTAGHQSLIVRRSDGVVVLAGQAHTTATDFSTDALAVRARGDEHGGPLPSPPVWLADVLALDPKAVYFAHDHSVWHP